MTALTFACSRCAWRGPSLTALLEHACHAVTQIADSGAVMTLWVGTAPVAPVADVPARQPGRPRKKKHVEFKFEPSPEPQRARFSSLSELDQAGLLDMPSPAKSPAKRTRHQTMFSGSLAPAAAKRVYPKKPLWPEGTPALAPESPLPPLKPQLQNIIITPSVKASPDSDDFDPERLADHGEAAARGEPGIPTPNPSHPVASHIRPATWRQVSAPREVKPRYCVCGIQLPMKTPERCPECGRATKATG